MKGALGNFEIEGLPGESHMKETVSIVRRKKIMYILCTIPKSSY